MQKSQLLNVPLLALLFGMSWASEPTPLPTLDEVKLAELDQAYAEAILSDLGLEGLLTRLGRDATNAALPMEQRANAHLAAAHLNWRHGLRDAALKSAEQALGLRTSADALLMKAKLLDAAGDQEQAVGFYKLASAETQDEAERAFIQLRMTMIETDERNVEALRELALTRDQEFQNRAAITLAVLGRPEVAIELFRPDENAVKPFVDHARLADWAIEAEAFHLAQEEAWAAYEKAEFLNDQRYALAVVVEAYREADELPLMLEELRRRGRSQEDLLRLTVDTLIETERLDEAIELYRILGSDQAEVEARQRLINLYATAGRSDEMVEEYRRLMTSEPAAVQWYNGLAAHFMNHAQSEAALEVWQQLEERNQEAIGVLLEGGALMKQMGFVDEAIAMAERYMLTSGEHAEALLFLFDTYLDRGENPLALAMLERLDALLPPTAAERRSLADAYERLERPEEAVRVYEQIRDALGELGYDERSRLAWLYSVAGRKEDSLAAWQDIWVDVVSPARRSFAESQMLLLAAELSMLGNIAVDLEQKLFLKQADRNEIDLLVRIYTEVGDKISATEVIDEYATQIGASELARLEQLGRVYMLLEDYRSYDKVLRQLYEIDEPARIDHIRNIILNLLSHDLAAESTERFEDIRHWLDELRKLDEESVSGEFEASIYSMGAFQEEAVASYRRALAERPEVSDNLLLVADLLKNMDRRDEAVAILQYVAENAKDDNEFVVAIDGLINMVGARTFFESLNQEIRSIFEWTKRVILERIAGVSDKFYLFTLLSEIAQETEDDEGSFVAVENSLPLAGVRRSAILRELVVMSTPDAGFAGFNTGQGDLRRQLKHGRRLVLLGEQLPPEVYIDLGKALLAKDDMQAASRAFDMINDITGLIDVNRTKGEIFLEEGFADEALEYFNRALNVNQDDLALLLNTALLFEREGRDDVAWRRYLHAIKGLLVRQPFELRAQRQTSSNVSRYAAFTGQEVDTSVTPEYRQYYEALVQGLLITWPAEPSLARPALNELEEAFEAELEAVLAAGGEDLQPLAKYSRLDHWAMLLRRIAARTGDAALVSRVDGSLLAHFAFDSDYTGQALGSARAIWGGGDPVSQFNDNEAIEKDALAGGDPTTPLANQLAIAKSEDEYRTELGLTRILGRESELFDLFRGMIAEGRYYQGLGYAQALLPDQSYERLVRSLAPTLKSNSTAFLEVLDQDAEILIDAEKEFGIEFADVSEVFNMLTEKDPQAEDLPFFISSASEGRWGYFAKRASFEDKIRFLETLVEGAGQSQFGVSPEMQLVAQGIEEMLNEPMEAESQDLFLDLVDSWLSEHELNDPFVAQQLGSTLLALDASEQNRPLLYRMAALFKERSPDAVDFELVLRDFFEGDGELALRELIDLRMTYLAGERLREAVERTFEALSAGERLDPQFALALYTEEYRSYGRASDEEKNRRKAELLPHLIELYPQESQYRMEWAALQLDLGNRRLALQALEHCYDALPGNEYLRAAFYLYLLSEQQYARAHLLNADGGKDLSNPEVVQELLQAIQSRGAYRFVSLATGEGLFSRLVQDRLRDMGYPAYWQWEPLEKQLDQLHDAISLGDDSDALKELRGIWRAVTTPANEDARGLFGNPLSAAFALSRLAHSPSAGWGMPADADFGFAGLLRRQGNDEPPLFEKLAGLPGAAREFDAYASALHEDSRRSFRVLYETLTTAWIASGNAEQRLEDLAHRMIQGNLTDHELRLLMMLADSLDADLSPREVQAFKSRMAQLNNPSDFDSLLFARTFAQLGDVETARRHYLLMAAQLMPQWEFVTQLESFQRYRRAPPTVNLLEFVGEIAIRLPEPLAMDIAERVYSMALPAEGAEEMKSVYDHFLLASLAELRPAAEVIGEAERISSGATGFPESGDGALNELWGVAKGVELARIHAMNGDAEAALRIIQGFFDVSTVTSENESSETFESYERAARFNSAAELYGLRHADSGFGNDSLTASEEVVFRADRLFPVATDEDNHWQGAEDWTLEAASTMLEWLEEGSVHLADTTEALLVAIYQFHRGGGRESALDLFDRLSNVAMTSGDEGLLTRLPDLILAAKHFETPLPSTLIVEALNRNLLDTAEAAGALRRYAELEGAEAALALAERAIPDLHTNSGLALLREVRALAEEVGTAEDVTGLAARIEELEDAKQELELVEA